VGTSPQRAGHQTGVAGVPVLTTQVVSGHGRTQRQETLVRQFGIDIGGEFKATQRTGGQVIAKAVASFVVGGSDPAGIGVTDGDFDAGHRAEDRVTGTAAATPAPAPVHFLRWHPAGDIRYTLFRIQPLVTMPRPCPSTTMPTRTSSRIPE
jgi:hypothetical protein